MLLTTTLASLTLLLHHASSAPSAPSATLDAGVIVGTTKSLPSASVKVHEYLGIPFGQPPVQNLRFAPPQKAKSWSKPKMTTKQPPSCIQQFNYPAVSRNFTIEAFDTPGPPSGESEDCLYINVYAPASAKNATVMFWIYGGGLQFGTNSQPAYDGSSLAAHQNVVVVAPNYRTNAFGFTMSPQLPLAERNLGFLDQRLALDWVQRNIHAFGGDPQKVTIFGESAGGASVDILVTSMSHNPPFRAAIMESGSSYLYNDRNNSAAPWNALMKRLGCKGTDAQILSCARKAKATTIQSIEEHMALTFIPVSDNVTQLEFPVAARAAGKIARVPIMTGTNAQEGRIFTVGQTNATKYVTTFIPGLPPTYVQQIVSAYPLGTPGLTNGYDVSAAINTDFIFQCPAAGVSNSSATQAQLPTWRYYFNATFPNTQLLPGIGVYHSSEIQEVFGTYPTTNATHFQMQLSQIMQKAWADFAKNPTTTGPGWSKWPNVGVLGSPNAPLVSSAMAGLGGLDARCAVYAPLYASVYG